MDAPVDLVAIFHKGDNFCDLFSANLPYQSRKNLPLEEANSFLKGTNNFDRITSLECVLFPLKYVFCQQRQLDCFNKGNIKTQYSPLKHNMKPVIFSFSLVFF